MCGWQPSPHATAGVCSQHFSDQIICFVVCYHPQAKKVCLYFSHSHYKTVIHELIKELQCVELITAELQPLDSPPFFRLTGHSSAAQAEELVEGDGWAVNWRVCVHTSEGLPVPLPSPQHKRFFASMKDMLKVPVRQMINLHRYHFLLSSICRSFKVLHMQE